VDLEHKKDHRIAANVVDTILEPLPEDSFRVLKFEGGEGLARLRDEDPIRLVGLMLDTFGNPSPLKEIKRHLVGVVEASGWSKWWNRVKAQLRDTGLFRVGDRPPYQVERLEEAVSYEEELVRDFFRSAWSRSRQIGRLVARRTGGQLPGVWEKIRDRLVEITGGDDRIIAIEAALILERGDGAASKTAVKGVVEKLSTVELCTTLQRLPSVDDHRRFVGDLKNIRNEDWREVASFLFKGNKNTLREAAMDLLEKNDPDLLRSLIDDVIRSPKSAPDALCCILQSHLDSLVGGGGDQRESLQVLRAKGARGLLVLVLDLLDHLPHLSERRGRISFKEIVGRVEKILVDFDCQFLRLGAEASEPGELVDIYSRLVKNESLAPHTKGAMLQCLLDLQPDLAQQADVPPWEEDTLYVTEAGLERKKEEFREIMEVKLPKVFKDIGRAADFGDLSENAEYTAALEERDRLTQRATQMKKDLDRVTVVTSDMLKDRVVALGARFRVRNLRTDEEVVYSMLGPWDGSPEDGVLSYMSPLGQVFHGRSAGEEFEAQVPGGTETYKLLALGSFFDDAPLKA
jgi:transcription elongation GreA/GreB family factor